MLRGSIVGYRPANHRGLFEAGLPFRSRPALEFDRHPGGNRSAGPAVTTEQDRCGSPPTAEAQILLEVWTLPEGSGVSREQLAAFVSKADAASQDLQSAVNTLENDLTILEGCSLGAFAKKFAQVKMDINREMSTMNQALSATSGAGSVVNAAYTAADDQQAQQVDNAGAGVVGLTSNLPV